MDTSILEKKFKKMSTKELCAKSERGNLSSIENEVISKILKTREERYVDSKFNEEADAVVTEILNRQEKKSSSTEKSDKKTETKSSPTPKKGLTPEDTAKIKKIVDEFEGSKKELVFHLFDCGITKQQLDKYRPEIAHWSYIYELAKQVGK